MNGFELVLLFIHFQTYLESVPLSNLSLWSQIHTVFASGTLLRTFLKRVRIPSSPIVFAVCLN